MSNPGPQTQWMYFDLKQHGIEVEGYETFYLQWLNEMPVASHDAADKTTDPNKRFHEKMWIIDGETDHGVAVVRGLNIANEYFRIDSQNPSRFWRDQDVIVKGDIIKDMVTTFECNFEYFLKIKESRGIFNTNIYWEATRNLLDKTTKVDMNHVTDERLNQNVRELAGKKLDLKYEGAMCRFFQNRPRYGETYIEQAYLKSIKGAQKEILIGNAYFVASDAFVETVKDAARRCVKVVILTNSPETNDLDFSKQITLEDTKAFTDSGDAVYQLQKEFGILLEDSL
jgi:phosphatidylserine/phosphatidylglycerophosphate/cardiolipin synthase-like enzyme